MNLFGLKDKVSYHEKLVFGSGVRFLFLFVLTDAILLKLDLQKRTSVLDNPPNGKLFVYQKCIIHMSKDWECVYDFQYKIAIGQCGLLHFFVVISPLEGAVCISVDRTRLRLLN